METENSNIDTINHRDSRFENAEDELNNEVVVSTYSSDDGDMKDVDELTHSDKIKKLH